MDELPIKPDWWFRIVLSLITLWILYFLFGGK